MARSDPRERSKVRIRFSMSMGHFYFSTSDIRFSNLRRVKRVQHLHHFFHRQKTIHEPFLSIIPIFAWHIEMLPGLGEFGLQLRTYPFGTTARQKIRKDFMVFPMRKSDVSLSFMFGYSSMCAVAYSHASNPNQHVSRGGKSWSWRPNTYSLINWRSQADCRRNCVREADSHDR